jgi:hypothetical protein
MPSAFGLLLAITLAAVLTTPAASVRAGQDAAPAPKPLAGKSYEYQWDGRDIGHPERAWFGRAYVPPETAKAEGAVPLVVFLHGLNSALIKYRWMGGGTEGDVRRIVGDLVAKEATAPVVIAGPSSIVASQVSRGASWNHFDLDLFVARTIERLQGVVEIDTARIVVAGHSGAGCSDAGGLAKVPSSKRKVLAILSIDTCMAPWLAQRLGDAQETTHVVASYQTATWHKRPFALFRRVFEREVASGARPGVLRALDEQRPKEAPHDATVALTFERWLPKILPPS